MIDVFGKQNDASYAQKAEEWFNRMQDAGLKSDLINFNVLILLARQRDCHKVVLF